MVDNKEKIGSFIDRDTSNWVDEYGNFKKHHLKVLLGNMLPNLVGFILMSLAFKYCAMSGLN